MDLDEINDGDPTDCICCDECCFCDNMIKLCCCFCRRKITRNNSNNQDVETGNKQQIELPEICGNFKNDINQEEDSKNRYNDMVYLILIQMISY